jgi:hypothetical protein
MKFRGCKECPEFGICDDLGQLTCNDGYLREGDICAEN